MIVRENDNRIDDLELAMLANFEPLDCPVSHTFTSNMYIREIFMPAGSLITSKIHKTEHPYTVSYGKVAVSVDNGEWLEITAPYTVLQRRELEECYILLNIVFGQHITILMV